jgi:uncharacterized membrane protein
MTVTRTDVGAWVLAAFWFAMGVLHFADHAETVRQMPTYFPWKDEIVVITGAMEILAAVMLLPAKLRHWGAFGTMFLLVIFTPAVIHIVQNNATPLAWPEWQRSAFRWGVIPANLALFVRASVYWRIGTSRM